MSKNTIITIIVLGVILVGAGLLATRDKTSNLGYDSENKKLNSMSEDNTQNSNVLPEPYRNKKAIVETNFGSFTIAFYDDHAPKAVENFVRLSQEGKYNNSIFHRVMKGFMIQGGDYINNNGTGGQSIYGQEFEDELNSETAPEGLYARGTVAMANRGPNTNGSQFFIMHADYPLPHQYTIFGQIIEGMDTVDKITEVPVLENSFGEPSVPTKKVTISKITIESR